MNVIDIPNLNDISVTQVNNLREGDTRNIRIRSRDTLTFENLNPEMVSVDSDGVVTVLANGGSANIITRNSDDEVVAIHRINILSSTTALSVSDVPEFITVGGTFRIDVVLEPYDSADRVVLSVDDESIGYIRGGEFRGRAAGEVEITVTSGSVSESFTVVVEMPTFDLSDFTVINREIAVVHGTSVLFRVDDTRQTVEWTSTNPSVATVDEHGQIHTVAAGYTCIIARVGGFEFFADVRVITQLESRILALHDRFPDGYFWNSGPPSPDFPEVSQTPCNHPAGVRMCIGQCAGFAHLISNEVFGTVRAVPRIPVTSVANVRQGDYVRYSMQAGHAHSVFVIRVIKPGEITGYNRHSGEHTYADRLLWLVVHCNWYRDCGILWYTRYDPAVRVQTLNTRESYSRIP
jgi:hypothetical protein